MNYRSLVHLAFISATTLLSQTTVSQSASAVKSVPVPLPKGTMIAEATTIDKDRNPPMVHLKGGARVRIYTTTGNNPGEVVIMRADEVDLDQTTGEISPCGNVHIMVEARK